MMMSGGGGAETTNTQPLRAKVFVVSNKPARPLGRARRLHDGGPSSTRSLQQQQQQRDPLLPRRVAGGRTTRPLPERDRPGTKENKTGSVMTPSVASLARDLLQQACSQEILIGLKSWPPCSLLVAAPRLTPPCEIAAGNE